MAGAQLFDGAGSSALTIRRIGVADLKDALTKGYRDFEAMPSHAVFLCVVYPVIGLLLGRAVQGLELLPMLFPIMAGFALIGPFAAIGLYELSRRRELGLAASAKHVLDALRSPSTAVAVATLGAMLLLIFTIWLLTAQAIFQATFNGVMPASIEEFVRQVFTTRAGWILIIVGNGCGFLFAATAFSLSVVSFPLVLDRHVSAARAVATSLRVVAANPGTMAVWGLIIASALVIGSLPFLIGLIVVMPVLGHASWHLYRKVVA